MTSKKRPSVVLLLLLGATLGCTPKPASSLSAPDFSLKDLSGQAVSLSSQRGHPVILDFWATWCAPCRVSIPAVEAFYAKHKKDGLVVLGLNMDDDPSPVFSFVKQFNMMYPVLYAGNTSVASDYQMEGIPMFVLVDPDGHVIDRFDGYSPAMPETWENELHRFFKSAN